MLNKKVATMNRFVKACALPKLLFQDTLLKPPTLLESELINELRSTLRECSADIVDTEGSEEITEIRKQLRRLVFEKDPREFLRWDVVQNIMFVSNSFYVARELSGLKKSTNWRTRWKTALREDITGHPIPFFLYPESSGNLIHHVYHLYNFEEKTGENTGKYNFIFEFGGGYGCMCRLIHRLDFKGKYIIFDLPEFSALQTFFLKSLEIPVYSFEHYKKVDCGVICVSDIEQLKDIICNMKASNSLFIGTWSISEVPVRLRKQILGLVKSFKSYLIAFEEKWHEIDNVEFFNSWQNEHKDVTWYSWGIERYHKPYYLVGKRNRN